MAVFAPIPSASVRMVTTVKAGARSRLLTARRRSCWRLSKVIGALTGWTVAGFVVYVVSWSRSSLVSLVTLLSVTDDRTPVPGFFDLPVTGGTATFDMLELHPEEHGSAITLLARSMFSQ